ncbi:hypothetical protein HanXRQr2_Chr10g0436841 [Helianthus annuus]|uniref:Uncharacterized protein n=1 Tax=Helianthus annuus TaxID=4232 RepID=A0A9K3HX57_HELAN|nr:hypothetical protein HanXRQr2_Chr10g0436841 [Helianthus annuus]KAJ0521430.1 hypothetical protein HanIR_Chr10g0470811 [Helianthus annuus]
MFFKRINNNNNNLICEGRSDFRIIIIIILNLGLTMKLKGLYFRRENRFLDSLIDCHMSQIGLLYYMYRLFTANNCQFGVILTVLIVSVTFEN